ncbi:porin [Mesorhizobium sp. M0514]
MNAIGANGGGLYKPWGGNWAFYAGATYKLNETTSFYLRLSPGDQLSVASRQTLPIGFFSISQLRPLQTQQSARWKAPTGTAQCEQEEQCRQ